MIPWLIIVDPEDGSREYKARLAGIDFYIWRANGARFGISARSRLPNGASESYLSALPEGNRLLAAKTHRRSRRGQTGVAKPSWLRSTNT